MSQLDPPQSRYGRERACRRCGTRVALKATDCFFCGASLEDAPRRRAIIPWADLVLFLVIGGLLAFWWLQTPSLPMPQQVALARGTTTALASLPTPEPAATPFPPTATPLPTPTLQPTPTPAPTPIRYKVEAGDSLGVIADRFDSTIKDILEANGLTANSMIYPGDELIVPVKGPTGGPGPTATPSGGVLVYAVQPGDTVESIAIKFGSQVAWILGVNKMQATDLLRIGQSLQVPLTASTALPVLPSPTSPLPTLTPVSGYRAPVLLTPADGATIGSNDDLLLSWTAAGVLSRDEWYVVALKGADGTQPIAPYWTKGTTWRVSRDLRPAGAAGADFAWQVQVISGTPGKPGTPLSPASALRTFKWQ